MVLDRPSQIRAMLGSGKIIHIGGRPVVVPQSNPAGSRARSYTIQLALAFVAIYVIWGSTYLAIRYAVETIPPLVTAGIRHSIAGGIMLTWAWWRGFRPTRQQWVAGLALGALFFLIGHGTLHWAEQYVGSGLAALLMATEPMFILVLGWMMGQQRISPLSALGLGLGVAGVAMLTGVELTVKGSSPWGLLAVLLGSLAWSLGVVISPRLQLPTDALGRTALPTLCGAALLLIAAGVTGQFQQTHWSTITVRSIFGLGYLITFGSVHGLHVAAAAGSAGAGGDAHLCQSRGRRDSGMAVGARAFVDAGSTGVGGDSGSDCADSAGRASSGGQASGSSCTRR
jgi:drug/metabolite transporter (DMT)-like permease